ncbi:MAG: asparagine synthase (glutamine-hydrolyzing) [Sulfurimonas sp.]|uniref:asparagine synthase (glutamine-hydrolyzing) n=1 Tax=Sulfurimonas sp. TaxID=2022749 RepID=UPI0025E133F1|nr:asparagine synthase (glutamine-hydrolyzing) [Sulfurimonas sp.]MCK9492258.1 asparagine synthase (glutamine-hydrolyzing) [Sulfurimonas sp.]
MFDFFGLAKEADLLALKVVFDGEIYKQKELREKLKQVDAQSDEELVLASYLKWGADFVKYLDGNFRIAIYDKKRLYLYRDRFGTKPLFFMQKNRDLIFGSSLKRITPFLERVSMNKDALLSYLSFLAPTTPYTFFDGIYKLGPSEYLVFDGDSYEIKEYFNLLDTKPDLITDRDEALHKLEKTLRESIGTRLNGVTASLLSGGIDSASICAFAKQRGVDLETYTVGYKEFAKYDERENAKESADFLGLNNTTLEITQNDFIDASEMVLDELYEPLNDPAAIPLYLLFERIKKDGHSVILSGEGSDELFLGYRQYFEFLDIEQLRSLKNKNYLKKYFRSNYSKNREWEYYKRVFNETLLFRTSGELFTDLQKNLLLKQNIKDNHALKYFTKHRDSFLRSSHTDESFWYSYIDLKHFQAEHFLAKLSSVSSLSSIKTRTPFLDKDLASLVFSISPNLRYENGVTKELLKEIMKPHLNDQILKRKKKGFSNPYLEYLINSKKISLIKDVNNETGMFKTKELDEYIASASKSGFKQHIWGLYVLSVWIKKWML